MPQWRKLHTKVTESVDVNDMPDDFHRLLWLMLPLIVCRDGRGIDNPAWVKAKAMPLRDDVKSEIVEKAMAWYARRGMILRYRVDGRGYFQIVKFAEYQGPTTREAESNYPGPEQGEPTPDLLTSNSGVGHEQVTSKSCSDSDSDADADADGDAEGEVDATRLSPRANRPSREKPPTVKTKQTKAVPESVQVFREHTRRYPAQSWYPQMAQEIGDSQEALKLWGEVVHAWVGVGWNPVNVAGMLDCFKRHEIPGARRDAGRVAQNIVQSDAISDIVSAAFDTIGG